MEEVGLAFASAAAVASGDQQDARTTRWGGEMGATENSHRLPVGIGPNWFKTSGGPSALVRICPNVVRAKLGVSPTKRRQKGRSQQRPLETIWPLFILSVRKWRTREAGNWFRVHGINAGNNSSSADITLLLCLLARAGPSSLNSTKQSLGPSAP